MNRRELKADPWRSTISMASGLLIPCQYSTLTVYTARTCPELYVRTAFFLRHCQTLSGDCLVNFGKLYERGVEEFLLLTQLALSRCMASVVPQLNLETNWFGDRSVMAPFLDSWCVPIVSLCSAILSSICSWYNSYDQPCSWISVKNCYLMPLQCFLWTCIDSKFHLSISKHIFQNFEALDWDSARARSPVVSHFWHRFAHFCGDFSGIASYSR